MTGRQQPTSWADVLALVAQLDASGLRDAELVTEGVSIRVCRHSLGGTPAAAPPSAVSAPPLASAPVPAAPAVAAAAAAAAPSEPVAIEPVAIEPVATGPVATGPVATGPEITAPVLGVVYLRPAPDRPPFVQVGDPVTPDTTVAIIEVMKLMNPVPAGVHGVIAEIRVPDAAMVEYGDVLFRLQG